MNRQEFESLAGYQVSQTYFDTVITMVYNYHPAISEVGGKEQIASIFKIGGHGIINDMLLVAKEMFEIEKSMSDLEAQLRSLKNKSARIRESYKPNGGV